MRRFCAIRLVFVDCNVLFCRLANVLTVSFFCPLQSMYLDGRDTDTNIQETAAYTKILLRSVAKCFTPACLHGFKLASHNRGITARTWATFLPKVEWFTWFSITHRESCAHTSTHSCRRMQTIHNLRHT